MSSPRHRDGDPGPARVPLAALGEGEAPQRGEIIGRMIPRTTLRPAIDVRDDDATDDELAQLMRRTDPRTDGDAPSVERVRSSLLDAVGTADEDALDDPSGSRLASAALDRTPEERARAIVAELDKCGPGDEQAYLEPMRALGDVGLAALAAAFPGLRWFDPRLPHRKRPCGRDASPICSLLVRLGDAAAPTVRALLETGDEAVRYYAALVAGDLGAPDLVVPLALRAFDEDGEVREVALEGLAALARRREARAPLEDGVARALDAAAARVREKLASPACTPVERVHALAVIHALRDPGSVELLVPFVAWVERDVAATAREALVRITAVDHGGDAGAWRRWAAKHHGEPRAEWLVAALDGPSPEQRAYAHAELARILRDDFGYAASMGPIDRKLAQRRARKLARARGLLR